MCVRSVYRNFREARDFNALIDELAQGAGEVRKTKGRRRPESAPAGAGMSDASVDARFMAAAIALGRRGLGLCAPNPAVGALIVKDGVIVARGWTRPGGRPHAETEALREAGAGARRDALRHFRALLPSWKNAALRRGGLRDKAGLARVVSALEDPDPRGCRATATSPSGRGGRQGEATAYCAEAALRANLGHVLRVTSGSR